jgi:hypothetical protein
MLFVTPKDAVRKGWKVITNTGVQIQLVMMDNASVALRTI